MGRPTPRTGPLAVSRFCACAVALVALCVSGCTTAAAGAYIMPHSASKVTAAATGDLPTVFVSSAISFSANAEVAAPACAGSQGSAACKAWLKTMGMSLSTAAATKLRAASQAWRFVPVASKDTSWRDRAKAGDLHVSIGFEDLFDRQFSYGVLLMWRKDTYDTTTLVRVSDATSHRELATFNVSDRADLGLNYVWFIDVFIPLFPLYWDENTDGRANLLARLFGLLTKQLVPVLSTASKAASVERSRDRVGTIALAPAVPAPRRSPPRRPAGGGDLDLRRWLELPNVRLLAVDFYADWCQPCKQSMPRWKALHEKYRDQGLRVIVVHTQSRGGHATPGWAPDHVVADPYGVIAKNWGVGDRLPQAFLWSWDGKVLASGAGIEQVARSVKRWISKAPRITVAAPEGGDGKPLARKRGGALKRAIRGELTRLGKFDMVADKHERAMLARLRKQSHGAGRDAGSRCQLGREVSANMMLKVVIEAASKGGREALRLELFGVEQSCMLAWSSVPVSAGHEDAAAAEAVSKLLGGLKVVPRIPGG